ncbi:MAG: BadF/BadG/BcrA/BcrD ATPase family protein [Blastocatellia bacterium]
MSKSLTSHREESIRMKSALPRGLDQPSRKKYYLGIDGGGTKTQAVITDAELHVLGEAFSGASNPVRVGLEEAVSNIDHAVSEACLRAGIEYSDITSACAALAGISHPIHYETIKDALDHRLGLDHLEVVTDARAALEGALDGQPGVVLIAGTGSIAMGVNAAGQQVRSGGWGPTLSDEGSGYDIARHALRAVISSFDGRAPKTLLTDSICRELGISSAKDLPGVIYNSDSESVEIASLARLVAEAAEAGDMTARDILAHAGRDLGELAISVIKKLGLQSKEFRVACVGSVFKSGECILGPLSKAVLSVAPGADIGPPLYPPTIGAVKLAQALV